MRCMLQGIVEEADPITDAVGCLTRMCLLRLFELTSPKRVGFTDMFGGCDLVGIYLGTQEEF